MAVGRKKREADSKARKSIRDAQERAGKRINGYGCDGGLKFLRKVTGTDTGRTLNRLPVRGQSFEIQCQTKDSIIDQPSILGPLLS